MTNETKPTDRTARIVFAGLAANAATAFTIQAWMTYGFGAEVWGLPFGLCLALIFALDVFAVTFMMLTYLLRGTGWPRVFVTVVFLFAIAAQVYAAELYGEHKQWTTEIRWFASLPAVLLALSQEGVIVWRTHRADPARVGRKERPTTPPPPPAVTPADTVERTTPEQQAVGAPPARVARAPRPTNPPPAPAVSGKSPGRGRAIDPAEQARRDKYALQVIRGGDKKLAATAAKVSVRSIELWVASWRERNPHHIEPEPTPPVPETAPVVETQPANPGKPQLTEGVNV